MDHLYKDIKANRIVRIVRVFKDDTVVVLRIDNKTRYITDKKYLRKVGIKTS